MARKTILLVEDEAVSALELKSTLMELGYDVAAIVSNGEDAVRAAADLTPDLILMDIRLDGPMSGIEAAAKIKETRSTPIIYLTAFADDDTIDLATRLTDPFGYLPKPCSTRVLATTMAMAIRKGEAEADRQKTEERLKQVVKEQRIILDNIGVGVLFVKERKIIWANHSLERMFGYSFAEMEGKDTELFFSDHETYLRTGTEGYAVLGRGERYSGVVEMRRKDGTRFWCSVAGQAVNPGHLEEGVIGIIEDVTERRWMEEALRQSEDKYRTVADFTHDWEFWIGPDDEIRYLSPSCDKITGRPVLEFEEDPSLLRRIVHPDDLYAYDHHRHGARGREISDGFEYRIIRPDGSIRWISHVCRPVYDDQGHFLGTRGSNRDVTESKGMEAELVKARNLESLGVLAGGIAHDFNNLFQGLLGNLSLAKMCTPESSDAYPFLQAAEQVYVAASALTNQLLAFSSGGISIRADLKLGDLVREEVESTLRGSSVVAEFDLTNDPWVVHVDPLQLRQVVRHLVQNARDAMPSGGRLMVTVTNETLKPSKRRNSTLAFGNYVRISLQDQGGGITQENLPRIFDPYFSTKERGVQKGMGLGLPLCDTIIRKHGGAISVESMSGRGATFHVRLPAVVSGPDQEEAIREQGGEGPRILIMDDESGVVQVATKFLRMSGYRVDSATNGEAAITAFRLAHETGDPYAVVILDLSIPGGLGGKEVISALKMVNPEVKAIVSSGYINDPAMTDCAAYGFVEALAKPYGLKEMKAILDHLV